MIKRIIFALLLLLTPITVNAQTEINMGLFKITAYCPCQSCSCHYGRHTASLKMARSNHTVAVDPSVINVGDKLKVGGKIYYAEDTGGRVIGDTIDIFFDTHEEVEEFGVKYKNVKIIR